MNKKDHLPRKDKWSAYTYIVHILKFYSSLYPLSLHTTTKPSTCPTCLATTLTYEDLDTYLLIRRISFQKILCLGYYFISKLSIIFYNLSGMTFIGILASNFHSLKFRVFSDFIFLRIQTISIYLNYCGYTGIYVTFCFLIQYFHTPILVILMVDSAIVKLS